MNLTFLKSEMKSRLHRRHFRVECLTEDLSLPMTEKKAPTGWPQKPESLSEFLLNSFVVKRFASWLTVTVTLKMETARQW